MVKSLNSLIDWTEDEELVFPQSNSGSKYCCHSDAAPPSSKFKSADTSQDFTRSI